METALARHITQTSIIAAVLFSAGCVTDLAPSSKAALSRTPVGFVNPHQARDLAFGYRRQAAEITELASHIEFEASVFSRQSGPRHPETSRRLAEVKALLAAAEEADELARTYRRQVPHGQVQ